MMPSDTSAQNRPAGFTLIELLIVLCIIGLLALLAYPQFDQSVHKAKRTEAKAALLRAMQQQERYYSQHNRYMAYQGIPSETAQNFIWFSSTSAATSAYQISATACAGQTIAQCVELSATPGTELVDRRFHDPLCGVLTLNSRHERSAASQPLAQASHDCQ